MLQSIRVQPVSYANDKPIKVSIMQTLREKVAKTIKFTPSGWIILNEWVNEGKPNEYLNSIKFDDKDYALDWLLGEPGRYTVDSSCKV